MPRPSIALLGLVLAALAACEAPSDDAPCATDRDCPAGARCVATVCARRDADAATDRPRADVPTSDAPARDAPADAGDGAVDDVPGDAAGDASCRAIEGAARVVMRPVDVILIVDTSASTGGAPARVQREVNEQLARILDGARVDYRVVLLASGLTIGPPLSTSGRLHVAEIGTGSGDPAAFRPLLEDYARWRPFLRPGVEKVFLHFTDSVGDGRRIEGYAGTFDDELYRIDPANFGTRDASRVTYHAVVGLAQRPDMPTRPYLPSEPVVAGTCASPEFRGTPGPGAGFQEVAIRTGGVRFPICLFPSFDVLFRLVAESVVEYAAPACSFEVPTPPMGAELNLRTVVVRYRSGARSTLFRQVSGATACSPTSFYIAEGRINLCPDACAAVRADRDAQLSIAFGCDVIPG